MPRARLDINYVSLAYAPVGDMKTDNFGYNLIPDLRLFLRIRCEWKWTFYYEAKEILDFLCVATQSIGHILYLSFPRSVTPVLHRRHIAASTSGLVAGNKPHWPAMVACQWKARSSIGKPQQNAPSGLVLCSSLLRSLLPLRTFINEIVTVA